jgi:hypothetical protein
MYDGAHKSCKDENKQRQRESYEQEVEVSERDKQVAASVLVTTEMFCPDLKMIGRKGIITAEQAKAANDVTTKLLTHTQQAKRGWLKRLFSG